MPAIGTPTPTPSAKPGRAVWTMEDEKSLINFMKEHKSEAGDGWNFKKATWQAAAVELSKRSPKTWSACKSKWQNLKATFEVVSRLANQSGFSWDHERGADIQPEGRLVWQEYVQKHPKAAPFRNRGWAHFDDFAIFAPSKARG
ncbi:hypothetical protein M378DRAFT_85731, partial [Amanita muscaria Koide BX008]